MNGNSSERELSPISKDLNLIGKLIVKSNENPERNDSPIHVLKNQGTTIGINTTKLQKWNEEQDNLKPVTHFKMHSSVYKVNVHNHSQELSRNQNQRSNFMNISRKITNKINKKSPIGTICKQDIRQKSVPVSPKVVQMTKNNFNMDNKQTTSPQLPHIKKIQKNVTGFKNFIGNNSDPLKMNGFKNSYSERHTPRSKKHPTGIGKTYTASVFQRKYDPDEEQSLQNPKKGSKIQNSRIKFPSFINNEQAETQTVQKKEIQQQTGQALISSSNFYPKDQEEEKYFQSQKNDLNLSTSNLHGFIYNKNPNSENSVAIDLRTPISKIKQLLVEGERQMFVSFLIPQIFFIPPSQETTSQELHLMMLEAFSHVDMAPQIVSIKKYINCAVMRDKKLCILWNYNGKVYFGGWDKNNMLTQGNKHGIGLEWVPARYVYYGEFKDNKKQGYGIMKKANKQVYVGCWKNNQRNGWGRVYDYDGELIQNGQFLDGSLIFQRRQND